MNLKAKQVSYQGQLRDNKGLVPYRSTLMAILVIQLAYFSYEISLGLNKECIYNYNGSQYIETYSYIEMCPLFIEVK